MTYQNKEYQKNAVDQLVKSVAELLVKDAENKVCVFQSPTGSGKTVMVAKFIEQIIKELPETDLCFLWVSIGKGDLQKQSKKALQNIFDGFPTVNLLEDEFFGSRKSMEKNEVVVVNWEKLYSKYASGRNKGRWKNKLMREGEGVNFIEVLETTRQKRSIVLIIDESHYAGHAKRTNELRNIINAHVTLEMSATPKIQPSKEEIARGNAKFIYVNPKDVIEEGMIKKEIIINKGVDKLIDDEKTSQDIVIEAAYKKRLALKKAFEKIKANINPLCLIQLPNAEAGEAKKEIVEAFLNSKGITEANGKLAVWLSAEKSERLNEISDLDNQVEFLIFKQAIDTGWDCPRAHILVKLRDIRSYTFEIQTVGRILRMPELKHYDEEKLNTGYIYTNLQTINVQKENYNPNIIKHLRAKRKPNYKSLRLQSYYKIDVKWDDIDFNFSETLENVFCQNLHIEKKPTIINTQKNRRKLQEQGLTTEIKAFQDKLVTTKYITPNTDHKSIAKAKLSDNDLQEIFNAVIKENLNGFAPKHSVPIVRGVIYQWFKKYLGMDYQMENGVVHILYLFLHPENLKTFSELLNQSTQAYKSIKKAKLISKIKETIYDWDVNNEMFFNQHTDEKLDYKLNVFYPCFLSKNRSNSEKDFENYLETKTNKIEWWFKNGEHKKDFFGIKYEENGLPQAFYPDYIIQLKSGKTFIGEIKSTNNTAIAEALQTYIEAQNAKGKKLTGGMIVKDKKNQWRVNQLKNYNKDFTDWNYFENLL